MLPEGVPAFAACGVHCQVLSEQPVVSVVPDPGHAPGPRQLSGMCVPLASRINVLSRRSKLYFYKFTPLHQCPEPAGFSNLPHICCPPSLAQALPGLGKFPPTLITGSTNPTTPSKPTSIQANIQNLPESSP